MNVVITGYYGFGNEGDELLLETLVEQLSNEDNAIHVLSNHREDTTKRHHVPASSRWQWCNVLEKIRSCDVLIFGGGGLIQDLSGPWTPAYYLFQLAAAKFYKKKVVLVAQGFGPIKRFWNRLLVKALLPKADLICPRDQADFNWCLQVGVPRTRMILGADLVWLKAMHYEWVEKRNWIICLRADWLEHRIPDWVGPVIALAKSRTKQIRFIAIGNQGDQELLKTMGEHSSCKVCSFADEQATLEEQFEGAELVISMRYHGLLLGARFDALPIGFGKDGKINYLLESLGQTPMAEETMLDKVTMVLNNKEQLLLKLGERRRRLIQQAQSGMEAVKACLKEEKGKTNGSV